MQETIEQYQQQIKVFDAVKFTPDGHVYTIGGKPAQSVTSILNNYVKPFESAYWAEKKSKELNLSAEELLARWELNSQLSKVKGTVVHAYIESVLAGDEFAYPESTIVEQFGYDPVQDAFNQIVLQTQKFMLDINDKMFPVASEFIVGDRDAMVCGTIDQLFYNKKSDKLEIWDWKTNKAIKTQSRFFHLAPLAHIPDTELDHYSLQLSLYKLILEKNAGLELGNSYLVWFNENNSTYQIFKTKDYSAEARLILKLGI